MKSENNSRLNKLVEDRTLLMCAAFDGDLEAVLSLLREGSHVNAQDKDGDTALMFAAFNGHYLIVRTLLLHGADVMAQARNGWTAKQAAQSKNHTALVKLLGQAEEKAIARSLSALDEEFGDES